MSRPRSRKKLDDDLQRLLDEILRALDTFDWVAWANRLKHEVSGDLETILHSRGRDIASAHDAQWRNDDPFVQRQFTEHVGDLITSVDGTTRDNVIALVRAQLQKGPGSVAELGAAIVAKVREQFDGYQDWRADTIARTETANIANQGSLLGFRKAGIAEVDVIDGDGDEACARANGQRWTIEYALSHLTEHPNCTRDFTGVVP